jgi:hypothetical protein
MNSTKHPYFKKRKLIIVEGHDDGNFIYSLLKHLDDKILDLVDVDECKGKDKLQEYMETAIAIPDFQKNVGNIAIIFDSDKDPKSALSKITSKIKAAYKKREKDHAFMSYATPKSLEKGKIRTPNINTFLLPNNQDQGSLEDLYLSTLNIEEQNLIQTCIEDKFLPCIKRHNHITIANQSKLKVQTFLAAHYQQKVRDIGFAATKQKINFDAQSESLDTLKKFLLEFAKI